MRSLRIVRYFIWDYIHRLLIYFVYADSRLLYKRNRSPTFKVHRVSLVKYNIVRLRRWIAVASFGSKEFIFNILCRVYIYRYLQM